MPNAAIFPGPLNTSLEKPLHERRAALRAWLRLSAEAQAQIPQPRVYATDARQRRCVENIAKANSLRVPPQ